MSFMLVTVDWQFTMRICLKIIRVFKRKSSGLYSWANTGAPHVKHSLREDFRLFIERSGGEGLTICLTHELKRKLDHFKENRALWEE